MKLNKYQQHYHNIFKQYNKLLKLKPFKHAHAQPLTYRRKDWEISDKYYRFKRIPHILMNSINLKIHDDFESSTARLHANKKIIHGLILKRIINNKNVFFTYNLEYNKFDAYTLKNEVEYCYDLIMMGNNYSMEIEDTEEPILQHIDFNKEFTEEFLFQESLMHNYDLVLWQETFKILTVLNNINEYTIAKIYAEFIK